MKIIIFINHTLLLLIILILVTIYNVIHTTQNSKLTVPSVTVIWSSATGENGSIGCSSDNKKEGFNAKTALSLRMQPTPLNLKLIEHLLSNVQ